MFRLKKNYIAIKLHSLHTKIYKPHTVVRTGHIFKHWETSSACRSACSRDNFAIIDQASTRFAVKIKEALHIVWDKPTLDAQVKDVNLKLLV